jgi:hypothetical protein
MRLQKIFLQSQRAPIKRPQVRGQMLRKKQRVIKIIFCFDFDKSDFLRACLYLFFLENHSWIALSITFKKMESLFLELIGAELRLDKNLPFLKRGNYD